jgi:cobalt-zinc-cadmium efflux system outer membrane protein
LRGILPVVVALVAAHATPVAQQTPVGSLTLSAAMDRALAANPTVAAARLRAGVQTAGLAVASERLNPEVSVELTKETPRRAVGVAVPLELGGKRSRRIAVSEAAIRTGAAELAAVIADIRNNVRRSYFEALVADTRVAVLGEQRMLSQRARDAAQARFDSGDAPRLEVLQADLALATVENETTAAEGLAVAARTRLNALQGQPLDVRDTLSTSLDVGGALSTASFLDLASRSSAELAVLDRQLEEQRARIALAHALRVPDVTPTASFTQSSQPDFDYGWRAGVALSVPLFTTHTAGVALEQAAFDQLTALLRATLLRITGDVTAGTVNAEAQRQAYVRYRDVILPQAQQVEQLAQASYELGQTGIAALLQALQASRDVRLRSLDTISLFHTALADLEHAVGVPIP